MKKIRIHCIEGYYYIEDDTLIYNYESISLKKILENKTIKSVDDIEFDECEVSDLSDLTISQYNELVGNLNKHYPNYNFNNNNKLKGRFI